MFRQVQRWSLGVAGVLVLGFSAANAQAQSAEEMAQFEEYLRVGTEAQKNGEYRQAIEQLSKAAEIVNHPRLQMEIGQSYEQLGECKKARATYEKLGRRADLSEQYEAQLGERLEGLESCVGYGELAVECSAAEAEVELVPAAGGQAVSGVCPGSWQLPEGEYALIARREGMEDERRQVRVVEGETKREFVQFVEPMVLVDPIPGAESGGTHWGVYAGVGAVGVGAVLTTIALISDAGAGDRLVELQKLEQQGNAKLFAERSSENESIRTRNIGLYAGGAALLLGGGGVLVWSLLSADTHADRNPDGAQAETDRFSLQLAVHPTEVGLRFRW